MPEYVTSVCPYCSAALVTLPKADERCSACGQPIHVRPGPDGYTYLLREGDLPVLEQAWTEHQRELTEPRSRIIRLLPRWSLALVALATVVQVGVVLGVAVPVGKTVLSGPPRPAAAGAPHASGAGLAGHSPAPSSKAVATPASGVDGVTSGPVPTAKPTPRPTPDRQRPAITVRTPGRNAANVPGGSTIRIVFSEPIRNVSDATIQLINVKGGWRVHASVRYDAAKRTAIVTPQQRMYPNTDYSVAILAGLTDRAGNRLTPTSWSFRVGAR